MKCHQHDRSVHNAFRPEHWCYVRKGPERSHTGYIDLYAIIYDAFLEQMTAAHVLYGKACCCLILKWYRNWKKRLFLYLISKNFYLSYLSHSKNTWKTCCCGHIFLKMYLLPSLHRLSYVHLYTNRAEWEVEHMIWCVCLHDMHGSGQLT